MTTMTTATATSDSDGDGDKRQRRQRHRHLLRVSQASSSAAARAAAVDVARPTRSTAATSSGRDAGRRWEGDQVSDHERRQRRGGGAATMTDDEIPRVFQRAPSEPGGRRRRRRRRRLLRGPRYSLDDDAFIIPPRKERRVAVVNAPLQLRRARHVQRGRTSVPPASIRAASCAAAGRGGPRGTWPTMTAVTGRGIGGMIRSPFQRLSRIWCGLRKKIAGKFRC